MDITREDTKTVAPSEELIDSVGLDHALLIEYTNVGMRIMKWIGVPMLCVIGPMNCKFGGNNAGEDHLSYLSFGNVVNGSWLYWIHAACVWYVVVVVRTCTFQAMKDFQTLRFKWLRQMASIRSKTIFVDNVGGGFQTDGKLKEFFEKLFPGKVESAYIAKDLGALPSLIQQYNEAKRLQFEAAQPKGNPKVKEGMFGPLEDAGPFYDAKMRKLWEEIKLSKEEIDKKSQIEGEGGCNCQDGFVTFTGRLEAEMALRMNCVSEDSEDWGTAIPPEPSDVLWVDLTQDPDAEFGRKILGYALIAGLYFAYMPLVIGITNVATAIDLGPAQSFWEGLAPTLGLQVMIAFLPTFIVQIFSWCFTLRASANVQYKLSIWYFWFQIVFVVCATAVGQNANEFSKALVTSPFAIFNTMAETMPGATHYYMNFMMLQWATHPMNMLRYVNLVKYFGKKQFYEDEEAAKMAEPEDQDYYGIGSRSARWTINLVIGLVFGTLCPPMCLLVWLNLFMSRLCYGYLLPFAETKKADLGGVFYVAMLKHLYIGLYIYCIMMIGVLYNRSDSSGPMVLIIPTLAFVAWNHYQLSEKFEWELLPLTLSMDLEKDKTEKTKLRDLDGEYRQPELFSSFVEVRDHALAKAR